MKYNEEQRTKALYYYLGWQGGTVHQLANEIGLTVQQILYDEMPSKAETATRARDFSHGFSAVRTCDLNWRVTKLLPEWKGNVDYWYGVIEGFHITGPLS